MKHILQFIIYYLVGFLGAYFVYEKGESFDLLDTPNERSSHSISIAKSGGIGIWLASMVVCWTVFRSPIMVAIVGLVGAVGFLEDLIHLSPKIRLAAYLSFSGMAALLFLAGEGILAWNAALFFFWILFITWTLNLYNFMDGIDGIAGITAIIGFIFIAYFSHFCLKNSEIAISCIFLTAACLGFLMLNFPKAKVFMGDSGSVVLGFIFGVLIMILSKTFLDFVCLCSFLMMFYMDEVVTMFLRVKNRENLMKAHRNHFYQILVNEKGIAHWKVSAGYGLFQVLVGISTLFLRSFGIIIVLIVLTGYFLGFLLLNYKIRKNLKVKY